MATIKSRPEFRESVQRVFTHGRTHEAENIHSSAGYHINVTGPIPGRRPNPAVVYQSVSSVAGAASSAQLYHVHEGKRVKAGPFVGLEARKVYTGQEIDIPLVTAGGEKVNFTVSRNEGDIPPPPLQSLIDDFKL